MALCLQVESQAPQHFRSSKMQAICDGSFARQSVCLVVSLYSGMPKSQAPQHFRSSKMWAICGGSFARQSVCLVVSLYSGMPKSQAPQHLRSSKMRAICDGSFPCLSPPGSQWCASLSALGFVIILQVECPSLKLPNILDHPRCEPFVMVMVAFPASLSAWSFPFTPACPSLKLPNILDHPRCEPFVVVALPASLSAWSLPFTPACPGQSIRRSFRRCMLNIDTCQCGLPIFFSLSSSVMVLYIHRNRVVYWGWGKSGIGKERDGPGPPPCSHISWSLGLPIPLFTFCGKRTESEEDGICSLTVAQSSGWHGWLLPPPFSSWWLGLLQAALSLWIAVTLCHIRLCLECGRDHNVTVINCEMHQLKRKKKRT